MGLLVRRQTMLWMLLRKPVGGWMLWNMLHLRVLRMRMRRLMLRDRTRMAVLRELTRPGRLLVHRGRRVRIIYGGVRHIGKTVLRRRSSMRMLLRH